MTPAAWAAGLGWWIAAGKVILFSVGNATFLADRPAADLAWVYLGLAGLAACGAPALAAWLERRTPGHALGWLLLAAVPPVLAAALGVAADLPGAALALLILAHLYGIATEIAFWLVAGAWLPPPELRRATVWICLAAALGGCAGGLAAERLLIFGASTALSLGMLLALGGAGLWLAAGVRALRESSSTASVPDEDGPPSTAASWAEILAHPLGPPLGAAMFLLTLVWSLTEFLCLGRYQELLIEQANYTPEDFGRWLALLFAVLQLVECLGILLLAGPVTRLAPPSVRSALFPLGALVTLLLLAPDLHLLWPVLLAHAYTEAVSNALFDPVHASNVAAVPARLQSRLRAFADGICYPLGMAAGALILLAAPATDDAPQLILLLATSGAILFLGVGLFTGAMIGPSLLSELGLTTEVGSRPSRAVLRTARRALDPWSRRASLRDALLAARDRSAERDEVRRRVDRADRRAVRTAFVLARRCDPEGPTPRLEAMLDARSPERRALAAEALLSLPLRGLFRPFVPALRRRYLPR